MNYYNPKEETIMNLILLYLIYSEEAWESKGVRGIHPPALVRPCPCALPPVCHVQAVEKAIRLANCLVVA